MVEVTLFMRSDCHLCEVARKELEDLQATVPHHLTLIDVDSDAKLKSQYGFNVPVVVIGPYKLSAPINKRDLEPRDNCRSGFTRVMTEVGKQRVAGILSG